MVKEKSQQTKSAAEAFYKGAFGFKPSERILQLEKLVSKQYFKFNQTTQQIAEDSGVSLEETQRIIQAYQVKNQ
jgi:hypothetical protein